jgi:LEA14-like dessication related protein
MVLKRSLITLAVVVVIALSTLFFGISYLAKSLEFAGGGIGQINTSGMDITLVVCNPSFVPVTVESVESDMRGASGNYGSLEVTGKTVQPLSEEQLQGTLGFTDSDTMKTFVNWVLNNESNADFNSTLLIKTKVLGLIPYSYEKNYDLSAFSNLVFGKGKWDCQSRQNYTANGIRQQLVLVQARMSAADFLYSGGVAGGNNTTEYANETNSTENNSMSSSP